MSAMGHKRTYAVQKAHVRFTPNSDRESGFSQTAMSALPPKADMCGALAHVCFGPIADIVATSTLDTHCECHTGEALAMSFGQTVTSSLLRH